MNPYTLMPEPEEEEEKRPVAPVSLAPMPEQADETEPPEPTQVPMTVKPTPALPKLSDQDRQELRGLVNRFRMSRGEKPLYPEGYKPVAERIAPPQPEEGDFGTFLYRSGQALGVGLAQYGESKFAGISAIPGVPDETLEQWADWAESLVDPETVELVNQLTGGQLKMNDAISIIRELPRVGWYGMLQNAPQLVDAIVSQAIGKVAGGILGALGANPATVAIGSQVMGHLTGMASAGVTEGGSFKRSAMDILRAQGIDDDSANMLADKYARMYGPAAGFLEYASNIFQLGKATAGLRKGAIDTLRKTPLWKILLSPLTGALSEGGEELSQGWLEQQATRLMFDEAERLMGRPLKRPETEGLAKAAYRGGASGLMLGALGLPSNVAAHYQAQQAQAPTDSVAGIMADTIRIAPEAREYFESRYKGKTLTPEQQAQAIAEMKQVQADKAVGVPFKAEAMPKEEPAPAAKVAPKAIKTDEIEINRLPTEAEVTPPPAPTSPKPTETERPVAPLETVEGAVPVLERQPPQKLSQKQLVAELQADGITEHPLTGQPIAEMSKDDLVRTAYMARGEMPPIPKAVVDAELETRRAGIKDLEDFVYDRGGIKPYTNGMLSEEIYGVRGRGGLKVRLRASEGRGQFADTMADEAVRAGLLPEDANDTELIRVLREAPTRAQVEAKIRESGEYVYEFSEEMRAFEWSKNQQDLKKAGEQLPIDKLNEGDSFTIKGEQYRVVEDGFTTVTIQDGETITIPRDFAMKEGETRTDIFIDKGSHKAAAPEGDVVMAKQPQEQDELWGGKEMPFNLAGERIGDQLTREAEAQRQRDVAEGQRKLAADQLPLFPEKGAATPTAKTQEVQRQTDATVEKWKTKPKGDVVVVDSSELDKLGLSAESKDAVRSGGAEAFYHTTGDRIVVLADKIKSPEHLARVLLHEGVGHFGLRAILGDNFRAELLKLGSQIDEAELRRRAAEEGVNLDTEEGRLRSIEEYIAYEAQARNPTLWQKFIQLVRDGLRSIGISEDILNAFDKRNEIEKLIDTSRRFVERGIEPTTPTAKPVAPEDEVRLKRAQEEAEESAPSRRLRRHNFHVRLEADPNVSESLRKWAESEPMYEQRGLEDLRAEVVARIQKDGLLKAGQDIADPKSDVPTRHRVIMAQEMMRIYDAAAKTADSNGDAKSAEDCYNLSKEFGDLTTTYGYESGLASASHKLYSQLVDTFFGARQALVSTVQKAVDTIMNQMGGSIQHMMRIVQEENAKAADAVINDRVEVLLGERIVAISRENAEYVSSQLKNISVRNAILKAAPPETPSDIRFTTAEKTLDQKILELARWGMGELARQGDINETAFKAKLVAAYGERVKQYADRILAESILMTADFAKRMEAAPRTPRAKGMPAVAKTIIKGYEPKPTPAEPRPISKTMEIKNAIKDWFKADPATRTQSLVELLKAQGFEDADAIAVARAAQASFAEKATQAKQKRLERILSGKARTLKAKGVFDRLIELSNLKPLDSADIREAVATKFGLPTDTPEVMAKLQELAAAVSKAPEGHQKQNATEDVYNYIASLMPTKISDVGWSIWYANILSGYTTQERNFIGNVWNTLDNLGTSMIVDPKNAQFMLTGFLRGLKAGGPTAAYALKTGRQITRSHGKFGPQHVTELKGFLKPWAYVTRAMEAADALFFKAAQEQEAYRVAAELVRNEKGLTGAELWREVETILGTTKASMDAFRLQAQAEGLKGAQAAVRVQELSEQSERRAEVMAEAVPYAERATFHNNPEGIPGVISKQFEGASAKVPLLKIPVPFTKIVANVYNMWVDHTMWGYVRAQRGYKDPITGQMRMPGAHERAQLKAKAIIGTLGMFGLMAMDMAGIIEITGQGPRDKDERDKQRQRGYREHSIRIGNTWVDYTLHPLGLACAIIGNLRDALRYEKASEASVFDRVAYAFSRMGAVLFDMSFLSGLNQVQSLIESNSAESAGKKLSRYLIRTASTLVVPNLIKQIDRQFDPNVRSDDNIREMLMKEMPAHSIQWLLDLTIPDAPQLVSKPRINALGEPVPSNVGAIKSVIGSSYTASPVWNLILKQELPLTVPTTQTKIGYGERKRRMTDLERYEYIKLSGELIKKRIEPRIKSLMSMKKELAQEIFKDIQTAARDQAKQQIWLKSLKAETAETRTEFHSKFDQLKRLTAPDGRKYSEQMIYSALEQNPNTGYKAHFNNMTDPEQQAALDTLDTIIAEQSPPPPPSANDVLDEELSNLPNAEKVMRTRSLREQVRSSGNTSALDDAMEDGTITADEYQAIRLSVRFSDLINDIEQLEPRAAIKVYQAATPADRPRLRAIIVKKITEATNLSDNRKRELIKSIITTPTEE